jgi:hypothetical protein
MHDVIFVVVIVIAVVNVPVIIVIVIIVRVFVPLSLLSSEDEEEDDENFVDESLSGECFFFFGNGVAFVEFFAGEPRFLVAFFGR